MEIQTTTFDYSALTPDTAEYLKKKELVIEGVFHIVCKKSPPLSFLARVSETKVGMNCCILLEKIEIPHFI